MTDVGNGWCYETDDDERYHKAKKLAEDSVEGEERSDGCFIEEIQQGCRFVRLPSRASGEMERDE